MSRSRARARSGVVHTMAFSENGYYLASGGADGTVKLWDLRKLKNFKTIEPQEGAKSPKPIMSVAFDYSGTYLAYASDKISVDVVKSWVSATELTGHTKAVTSLKFGPNAKQVSPFAPAPAAVLSPTRTAQKPGN